MDGSRAFVLAWILLLVQAPATAQCEIQKILPPTVPQPKIFGRGLALEGQRAVVTQPNLHPLTEKAELAYVYERVGALGAEHWVRSASVKASDRQRKDSFGWVVDLSGDRFVAGADSHDHGSGPQTGAAYVFELVAGQWVEVAELLASDGVQGDHYGWAVAIDGDRVVVGAPFSDDFGNGSGKAYVFDLVGGQWQESAILFGSGPEPFDRFGIGIALDGDRILIGAQSGEGVIPDTGAVHVFDLVGGAWTETATLWASDGTFDSFFGYKIDLEGPRAVVGAMWSHTDAHLSGAAYVFEESGGTWSQRASLVPAAAGPERLFGSDVALDGDRILVGASGKSGGPTGAAHLFERTPSGWVERVELSGEDQRPGNIFGVEVELDGEHALVSAMWDDELGPIAGAVHALSLPHFGTTFGTCGDPSPCGLTDPTGGCPNSTGVGAALGVHGSNGIGDDALVLRAWRLPPDEIGAFVLGVDRRSRPFGDGRLVVDTSGAYVRLPIRRTGAGVIEQAPGWLAAAGAGIVPGSTWIVQLVYTDAAGPCGTGLNATNAVAVTFEP